VHVSGQGLGNLTTNAGLFKIHDVPAGVQEVEFEHPCYMPVKVTIPAEGDVSLSIGLPYDSASLKKPFCSGKHSADGNSWLVDPGSGSAREP
jgi:hypothetical protein